MNDVEITLYLRPEWARAAAAALRDLEPGRPIPQLSDLPDQRLFVCALIDLKEALTEAGIH